MGKDLRDFFGPAGSTGQLVKSFRKSYGITQTDMAAACGISQANLSAIENDKREVGAIVALKLSAVMGFYPDIILYPGGFDREPEYLAAKKRAEALFGE